MQEETTTYHSQQVRFLPTTALLLAHPLPLPSESTDSLSLPPQNIRPLLPNPLIPPKAAHDLLPPRLPIPRQLIQPVQPTRLLPTLLFPSIQTRLQILIHAGQIFQQRGIVRYADEDRRRAVESDDFVY